MQWVRLIQTRLPILCSSNHLVRTGGNTSSPLVRSILVSGQQRIVLTAPSTDLSANGTSYRWRANCTGTAKPDLDSQNGSSVLTIPSLPSGTACRVDLKVSMGHCSWDASLNLEVVTPPQGGDLAVTKSGVTGMYSVHAEGWEEREMLKPLTYSVFLVEPNKTSVPLSLRSAWTQTTEYPPRRTATVMIPPKSAGPYEAVLELRVSNALGAVASVTKTVFTNPADISLMAECLLHHSMEMCLRSESRSPSVMLSATSAAAQRLNQINTDTLNCEIQNKYVRERLMGNLQLAQQDCLVGGRLFEGAVEMLATGLVSRYDLYQCLFCLQVSV